MPHWRVEKGRELAIWIHVRARLVDDLPFITFSVSDNGRGMTEQQQATMWEQGISGFGSSGLGLAFVKQTVEATGRLGDIGKPAGQGHTVHHIFTGV